MKYDLHIHSNISDGKLSRDQIVNVAIKNKLEYISFTEHNDFKVYPCENDSLTLINGIEFDTTLGRSFHLLCYFPCYNNNIDSLILKYRENTNSRSDLLIKNIRYIYNIPIYIDDLMQFFNKSYITKRDIIDWVLCNNYSESVEEAANIFTNKNSRSYVPKYSLSFNEVVQVIKSSNGYVLLAHPNTLKYSHCELEDFILLLKKQGLDGIEVINSSKMDNTDIVFCKYIANKYNLLTSGGSDFHNSNSPSIGVEGSESIELIKRLKR